MSTQLTDRFGRILDYLRVSVTDHCNFRCMYCMPPEGICTLAPAGVLSFAEIVCVARNFINMGGKRIRLTGGEPLLRKNISQLVAQLVHLKSDLDIGLTTNGSHLLPLLHELKQAGLKRINISLDSLNKTRFARITHSQAFNEVFASIFAALEAGFVTKVNVVAMRDLQKNEMLDFAKLAYTYPLEVRFIEFMPLCGTGWHPEWILPIDEVRKAIQSHYQLVQNLRGAEVAQSFQLQGGKGSIGFIASMTEHFCQSCSRLRLTADGKLRPCLFSPREIDVKQALRRHASDREIQTIIAQAVWQKPVGHEFRHHPASYQLQLPLMPYIRSIGG